MSSIVLNHAVIGENSLLGAGSLVTGRNRHSAQCVGVWSSCTSDPPVDRGRNRQKSGKHHALRGKWVCLPTGRIW